MVVLTSNHEFHGCCNQPGRVIQDVGSYVREATVCARENKCQCHSRAMIGSDPSFFFASLQTRKAQVSRLMLPVVGTWFCGLGAPCLPRGMQPCSPRQREALCLVLPCQRRRTALVHQVHGLLRGTAGSMWRIQHTPENRGRQATKRRTTGSSRGTWIPRS